MPDNPPAAEKEKPGFDDACAQSPQADSKLFVIAFRCGRLGNRLSLFAHLIGYAEEHGHRVMNCTFHSYAHLFETTRRDVYCRYPAASSRSWLDLTPGAAALIRQTRIFYHVTRLANWLNEHGQVFGRAVATLRESPGQQSTSLDRPEVTELVRRASVVFVHGFNFESAGCVQRHAEKIRRYFRPIEEHQRASRGQVEQLRRDADVVVGVHIRHGDYREWRGGKYFFPTSRYAAWMQEMGDQFPGKKVSFLVCSNEPRQPEEFPGLRVGFGTNSSLIDLYALAQCDYIAGPPSTFTKWASFYGHKPLLHLGNSQSRPERERFRVSYLDQGVEAYQ